MAQSETFSRKYMLSHSRSFLSLYIALIWRILPARTCRQRDTQNTSLPYTNLYRCQESARPRIYRLLQSLLLWNLPLFQEERAVAKSWQENTPSLSSSSTTQPRSCRCHFLTRHTPETKTISQILTCLLKNKKTNKINFIQKAARPEAWLPSI